ncbi:MAG: hypothetical protein WCG99_00520 [Candidatus Berkelbacteria bacterium]
MVKSCLMVTLLVMLALSVVAAYADGTTGYHKSSIVVDLDAQGLPGANSVSGQADVNAVVKQDATAMFDGDNLAGPAPATTDYSGGILVTKGKTYRLDMFWCRLANGKALVVPAPSWARTTMSGAGNVTIKPDGSFVLNTEGIGYILVHWHDADNPLRHWMMAIVVGTKSNIRGAGNNIGPN